MPSSYVILDENPNQNENSDFIILGLKKLRYKDNNILFAGGCPMLFGGQAKIDENEIDTLKREVSEETSGNVEVEGIDLPVFNTYSNPRANFYTCTKFNYTGQSAILNDEFFKICKVSKGKLHRKMQASSEKTKKQFAFNLFEMVGDSEIDPSDDQYKEYEDSRSLASLYKYANEIGLLE